MIIVAKRQVRRLGNRYLRRVFNMFTDLDSTEIYTYKKFVLFGLQLANGPHSKYYDLLNIFAYGTLNEYRGNFS